MTAEQREAYARAVAEEMEGRDENVAAVGPVAKRLVRERMVVARLVARLRAAREEAGVSLAELEQRTGVQKSAWSRLENAKAPNPTVATLVRYAAAIGSPLQFHLAPPNELGE